MARERSSEEILDQMVYALQCVARHYGPGYNQDGLKHIRNLLKDEVHWCDAEWRVDVLEGGRDGNPDFCPKVIPDGLYGCDFKEVVMDSKGGNS